jgi:hypothetical protein
MAPRSNRKKTQLACNYCRDRKTRCDGLQPVCSPCLRRGRSEGCTYQGAAIRTQKYVAQLENRLRELENRQCASHTPSEPIYAANYPAEISDQQLHLQASRVQQHQAGHEDANNEHTAVDGLATVSPLPLQGESTKNYGAASTIAFIRSIVGVVEGPRPASDPLTSPAVGTKPSSTKGEFDMTSLILPVRRTADDFVSSFFTIVNTLYPIIHGPTFYAEYRALWTPRDLGGVNESLEKPYDPVSWATLNMIFALGCQFSTLVQPSSRYSLAVEFYERSLRASGPTLIDAATIAEVQLLLLTTVYLQSTRQATRCWNVLGLAIRAAHGLSLHSEQWYLSLPNQIDREMSRRIWYNCVILDKLQSMTFGRPTMLGPSTVRLPAAIDDEYLRLSAEGHQPSESLSQLCFFLQSIKLFEILSDILSTIYAPDPLHLGLSDAGAMANHIQGVVRLSTDLDRFIAGVPEHLQANRTRRADTQSGAKVFTLQRNVLQCRYLYTRLLLLRPLLLSKCAQTTPRNTDEPPGMASLDSTLIDRACAMCTTTALTLIDTIHASMQSVLRNSVWYTVYFTFSSATVILASHIVSVKQELTTSTGTSLTPLITRQEFQRAWTVVIGILEYHEDRIHSASRAIHVLETLKAKTENHLGVDRGSSANSPNHGQSHQPTMEDLRQEEWTADDFNIGNLDDAWYIQDLSNLDFLNFEI